jgi:acetylornithine deacetylase
LADEIEPVIRAAVDATFDDVVAAFREGVRIDSRNPFDGGPGEAEFQARYADQLQSAGAAVESWAVDIPALVAAYPWMAGEVERGWEDERPCVIGWLPSMAAPAVGAAGSPDKSAHLILNSHADTVGITDPPLWSFPPHAGDLVDGEIRGLGSLDAKVNLYAYLGAALALREAGILLARPVMIQSVADEERSGAGALDCVRRGYTATAAVVGEPTDLTVSPGSRGKTNLHLEIFGESAHPGEGWRGVNAIEMGWRYVEALQRLRDDLDRTRMHPLWAGLPAGHVWNLMAFNSGPVPRAVPARCELVYGIGLIGTERIAEMQPLVEAAIAEVTAADPWLLAHPPAVSWLPPAMEPSVADPGHPAVRGLARAVRRVQGREPVIAAASVATDARHLTNSGGIPSINFGPGVTRRAHSPNETIGVEDLRTTIHALALFLVDYCGIAGEAIASAEATPAGVGRSPQPSQPPGPGRRPDVTVSTQEREP